MARLTKRNENGVAYMAIADTLSKRQQEIDGYKPVLEALFAMFQKLAYYEDKEEQETREMKGLGILINCLAATDCPSDYNLKDCKRENKEDSRRCKFGNMSRSSDLICKECFKQAIESEYDQEGEAK